VTATPPPASTRDRRFKRLIARFAFAFALGVWLIPALPFVQHFYGSLTRHRVERRLRARGDWPIKPVVTNRFDAQARVRGERVSSLLTNQSLPWSLPSTFEIIEAGVAVPLILSSNVSASSRLKSTNDGWAFFAQLLATNEAHFAELHDEIQRSPHDLGFDYSPNAWEVSAWLLRKDGDWQIVLNGVEGHRNYLRAFALLAMRKGNVSGAIAALEDFLRLNELLKEQPMAAAQQSRIRGARMAGGLTWVLLHECALKDAELARLAGLWSDVHIIHEAVHAFQADLDSYHAALESIVAKKHPRPEEFFFGGRGTNATNVIEQTAEDLGRSGVSACWRFLYGDETVASFAECSAALGPAARTIPGQHRATEWVAAREKLRVPWQNRGTYEAVRTFPMTLYFYSIIKTDRDELSVATEVETEMAITRVAIAVERYRRRHGDYPETIQQLTPEFLKEPLRDWQTGQFLHYARDGRSFKLYASGWDGLDDGGSVQLRPGLQSYRNVWSGKDVVWLRRANAEEMSKWREKRQSKSRTRAAQIEANTNQPPAGDNSPARTNFPAF
jgi:hypothetical protein